MMTMKKLVIFLFMLAIAVPSFGSDLTGKNDTLKVQQNTKKKLKPAKDFSDTVIEDTLTNEFLDTLVIRKKLELNDYSLIGLQYGVGLSRVSWNPVQKQDMLLMPMNVGVMYTRYGKMFGYMPYFGFQAGLFYTQEGYQFEFNKENRGDVYPTHGFGPICQVLDIHRGDRLKTLVSMDTKAVTGPEMWEKVTGEKCEDFKNADHTLTMISTENGKTMLIEHNTMTPRAYDRMYQITGTDGFANKYSVEQYVIRPENEQEKAILEKIKYISFLWPSFSNLPNT